MRKRKVLKSVFTKCLILMLLLSLIGCAKKDETRSPDMKSEVQMDQNEEKASSPTADAATDGKSKNPMSNRKIIENRYISMETLEFEVMTTQAENLVYQYLGYIENAEVTGNSINRASNYNTRYATYTFRIPTANYNQFVQALKEMGNVVTERVVKEDVTLQYFDLQARTDSLKIQEERLLEIIKDSQQLSQIIEVEDKLTDVRYQIESYTATLNNLENLVDYGTVQLELREVFKETIVEQPAVTVGDKISKGFSNSIENVKDFFVALFIWLISASPYLVVWAVVILGVIFAAKKINARSKNKQAKKSNTDKDKTI